MDARERFDWQQLKDALAAALVSPEYRPTLLTPAVAAAFDRHMVALGLGNRAWSGSAAEKVAADCAREIEKAGRSPSIEALAARASWSDEARREHDAGLHFGGER